MIEISSDNSFNESDVEEAIEKLLKDAGLDASDIDELDIDLSDLSDGIIRIENLDDIDSDLADELEEKLDEEELEING